VRLALLMCASEVLCMTGFAAYTTLLPALQRPTISSLSDNEWVAVNTIIEERTVRDLIPKLKAAGDNAHDRAFQDVTTVVQMLKQRFGEDLKNTAPPRSAAR